MSESTEKLSRGYHAFADREARGVSPTYEAYANTVAGNIDLLLSLIHI